MGLTHYPNGILATPNLGGTSRLLELWESDNIFFVDGYAGSAGNTGKEPSKSKAKPSEAIAAASGGASIYVRPIGYQYDQTTGSNYKFYTDDIIIPYSKSHLAIIGAGNHQPFGYGGVMLRPSTVTGSLLEIKSNSNLICNMHFTLNGGTADSADGSATYQTSILMHRDGSVSRCYGNIIRGNRFSQDKSHPNISYGGGSIVNFTAQRLTIEDNLFENNLGGIVNHAHSGDIGQTYIRRNYFGGLPTNRDCDIILSHNSSGSNINVIHSNVFADGLPTHSGGGSLRFITMPYVTAGTGIIAQNWFAALDKEAEFDEVGSECKIAAEMFVVDCHTAATSTTAGPYGIIQPGS